MGPAWRSLGEKNKWHSPSASKGSSPIEYWWKWDADSSGEPNVGWAIEPSGKFADTELDPLNHEALRELLHGLTAAIPSTDSSWSKRLQEMLFSGQDKKLLMQQRATDGLFTTRRGTLVGTELTPQGPRFKTHFRPISLGLDQWEDVFSKLDPVNHSRATLHDFLSRNVQGKFLKPLSISVLNAKADNTVGLKWHFWSPHTNRRYIRDIVSLGGRIDTPNLDERLADMYDLMEAVSLGTQDTEDYLPGGHWYSFDISPGKTVPDVEIYVQLRVNGRDDVTIARGLASWMEAHGRGGDNCHRFLHLIHHSLSRHGSGDDTTSAGIQTFLAFRLDEGELQVTSYLEPAVFQDRPAASETGKERWMRRRSTLRRDE